MTFNPLNFLRREPGKESDMDPITTPASNTGIGTATAPAFDMTQLAALIAAETAKAVKPLQELLDDRETARDQKATLAASRRDYQGSKLKDLPGPYREQLGGDPVQWPAEEQRIRTAFRDDLKAMGVTVPNVGGDDSGGGAGNGTGAAPSQGVDISKMSAQQKVALGLKQSKPSRAGAVGGGTHNATHNADRR
jgi:hypothetical protein